MTNTQAFFIKINQFNKKRCIFVPMAGVINNKNAEKWTQEKTLELVQMAYDTISDDCYFLSDVADKCGVYRQLFDYLMDKFNDDQMVFDTLKRLYNKCEAIVTKKTAKGEIVPSLGIFILKAYHGLFETSKVNSELSGHIDTTSVTFKKFENAE